MSAMMHGQVWYGDTHAVIQRDGDATATVSEIRWNADGSVTLHSAARMLSRFDAFAEAARLGDQTFREELNR